MAKGLCALVWWLDLKSHRLWIKFCSNSQCIWSKLYMYMLQKLVLLIILETFSLLLWLAYLYSTQFWKLGPMVATGPGCFPLEVIKFSKIKEQMLQFWQKGFLLLILLLFIANTNSKNCLAPRVLLELQLSAACFWGKGETSDLTCGQIFDSYEYWRFDGKLIIVLGLTHLLLHIKSCPARQVSR